ncbi:MAG: hypothetical protein EOP17_00260 [Rhizobiaceae bacterium]|nr:MAG: hypothetical protein EOP17_00260 [Rhizobiaceae bacterium]
MVRAVSLYLSLVLTSLESAGIAQDGSFYVTASVEEVFSTPDHFASSPFRLCRFATWERHPNRLAVRGGEEFAHRKCLIGRLRKVPQTEPEIETYPRAPRLIFDLDRNLQIRTDESCLPAKTVLEAKILVFHSRDNGHGLLSLYGFVGDSEAAQMISVGATKAGPPIIAVLGAQGPTIWDFSSIQPGRLRAVVLVGREDQAAAHLPRGTLLRIVTPKTADGACGDPDALLHRDPATGLHQMVRNAFGREFTIVEDLDPVAITLDQATPPPAIEDIPRHAITALQPLVRNQVLPGIAGLTQLFQKGVLRNATKNDLEELAAARTKAGLPAVPMGLSGVYVITSGTTIPRGLTGANSVKFLIAKGAPSPTDHGSHNTYYFLADGRCAPDILCR